MESCVVMWKQKSSLPRSCQEKEQVVIPSPTTLMKRISHRSWFQVCFKMCWCWMLISGRGFLGLSQKWHIVLMWKYRSPVPFHHRSVSKRTANGPTHNWLRHHYWAWRKEVSTSEPGSQHMVNNQGLWSHREEWSAFNQKQPFYVFIGYQSVIPTCKSKVDHQESERENSVRTNLFMAQPGGRERHDQWVTSRTNTNAVDRKIMSLSSPLPLVAQSYAL